MISNDTTIASREAARRLALLTSVAFGTLLHISLVSDAHAAGGNGGQDIEASQPDRTGGQGYSGAPGQSAIDTNQDTGGGGGGAAGGGNGGSGSNFTNSGSAGGIGGTQQNPNGQPGTNNAAQFGGGGGGGGFNSETTNSLNNTTPLQGGSGGQGGTGDQAGGGGGGGAGGYGAVVTGTTTSQNSSSVTGGTGGAGGRGGATNFGAPVPPSANPYPANGGSGGDGGVGVQFMSSAAMLTNSGTITGGNGGVGGAANPGNNPPFLDAAGPTMQPGAPGAGGAGVVGAGLTINNTGSITGGMSGDGVTRAYAIVLTGGTNFIGGGGVINGGINVAGGASFMPALPGTAVGAPLVITGPLMFAQTSTYDIRITPKASDSVAATGTATLNGAAVNVEAGRATYRARQYTILVATGGVVGTFSAVSTNLAFLEPTLSYGANDVFLTINGNAQGPAINYTTAAATQNQFNVASGLTNAAIQNSGNGKVLSGLNQLTVPQARAAFDGLSGEGITAAQNAAHRSSEEFNAAIFDQTTFYGSSATGNSITLTAPQPGFSAYAPQVDAPRTPIHELADLPNRVAAPIMPALAPTRTWRAWATGFGGVEDIHGSSTVGSATQNDTIYGGVLGVDYEVTPNYLFGIALGGSDGEFSVANRSTFGSTTGGHIAFYDLATFGNFYGASSNSFSYYTNKTTRNIDGFGGLAGETERGTFDSHEFRTRLEFGRHFSGYGGTFTPFVALELAELRSNGFTETASSGPGLFALNVNGQSSASVPGFVGARYQSAMALGNGIILSPSLEVAYVHEFAPQRTQFGTLSSLPGSTFLVDGARPSYNAAKVKAGGEIALTPRSFIFANFDGEFSGISQFYGGKGGFRYVW